MIPYTTSVERNWPATAASTTFRGGSTQSTPTSTTPKPSSDGSHGVSATTALVRSSQTLPSPTAPGVAASDASDTPSSRVTAVPAPATAIAPTTPSALPLRTAQRYRASGPRSSQLQFG